MDPEDALPAPRAAPRIAAEALADVRPVRRARAGRATTGAAAGTAGAATTAACRRSASAVQQRGVARSRSPAAREHVVERRRRADIAQVARVRARRMSTPWRRGSVTVKSATVGVPSAAARCVKPVSTPMASVALREERCDVAAATATAGPSRLTRCLPRAGGCALPRHALPHGSTLANPAPLEALEHRCANAPRATACRRGSSRAARRRTARRACRRRSPARAGSSAAARPVAIAERRAGEKAAARDEVQIARNAVMDVVAERCERLADARAVEAVAARRAPARAISAPLTCSCRSRIAA